MCSSGMRNMHRKLSCFSSGWQLPVHPALDAHLPTLLLLFSLYALIVAHFPPGYNPGLCPAARHTYKKDTASHCVFQERQTGLEPATPTLARSYSTN